MNQRGLLFNAHFMIVLLFYGKIFNFKNDFKGLWDCLFSKKLVIEKEIKEKFMVNMWVFNKNCSIKRDYFFPRFSTIKQSLWDGQKGEKTHGNRGLRLCRITVKQCYQERVLKFNKSPARREQKIDKA